MLVSVAALVVCGSSYGLPQSFCPDVGTVAYAVVFAEKPSDGFEVFTKAPGQEWEDVTDVKSAALERSKNPWVFFNYSRDSADFNLSVLLGRSAPAIDTKLSADFSDYMLPGVVDSISANNFGLQGAY